MVVIKQNDYGQDLEFTVVESDGTTAVDLTSSTIKFKMARHRSTVNKVNSACSITDASAGTCTYTVQSGDTDTAGVYKAELELTWSSPAKVLTANIESIRIRADLPAT